MCFRVFGLVFRVLLIVLLFPTAHAFYPDPPIQNVTSHNIGLVPLLNDSYNAGIAINGTIGMDFYGTDINWAPIHRHVDLPLIHASARLLTIDPSVDNTTNAGSDPVLIFAWGSKADPLEPKDWEKPYPDHMGDDCIEYQNRSEISKSALITFSFKNVSTTVNTTSNKVAVPSQILEAMENTTGRDILNVKLNSIFDFRYIVDDRIPTHDGCRSNLVNFTAQIEVTDEINWTVEGNRTLFFLRAPVLNEQWFRNNRFDTVLFSNSRIYSGKVSANSNQTMDFRLYHFNISSGPYGIQRIASLPLNKTKKTAGYMAYNQPVPLQINNNSYGYLYEINYSYSGIGENILEISANSFFGQNHSFSQKILSRALSHSGKVPEEGVPANESYVRRSRESGTDELGNVTLSFGLAGVLVLILLIKNLIKK